MTLLHLATRGLRFYWRTHLALAAAVAVACAVLTGALAIGDSVRGTLALRLQERLGQVHWALVSGDRFFRAGLVEDLADDLGSPVVPILQIQGLAANPDGTRRANAVQVLGVDDRFFRIGPGTGHQVPEGLSGEGVFLNRALAERLAVGQGDTVLLRMDRPEKLSGDMPLSPDSDRTVAARLTVQALLEPGQFGDFRAAATSGPVLNAFVSLSWLQDQVDRTGRVNGLLVAGAADGPRLHEAIRRRWLLADAELDLRTLRDHGMLELRSPRVFLDRAVTEAAMAAGRRETGVLTYLVNRIQVRDRSTPYSMVAAVSRSGPYQGLFPTGGGDQGIVINQWLAEDLGAAVGDEINLTYFLSGSGRRLIEETTRLRVSGIVPMEGPTADPNLMPEFPGLAGEKNCRDWDPGIAIDLDRIRPKDEEYWDQYGGTPKAFVTLSAGQSMWANRFGDLTAVRWPIQDNSESDLSAEILSRIDPGAMGLTFHPVREQGQKSATQGTDFGPLFLGLSLFLIGAAVVLVGLLFVFSVEARASQIGTLLALGLDRSVVRRLLLWEGGIVAVVGAVTGTVLGLAYTRALIWGLSSIWRGAVASEPIRFFVRPASLATGAGIGLVTALIVMAWTLRGQVRHTAHQLLTGATAKTGQRFGSWATLALRASGLGVLCTILMVTFWGGGAGRGAPAAGVFFAAGVVLLASGLCAAGSLLRLIADHGEAPGLTLAGLAMRSAARRPGRSLAVIAMLACAVFMVIAVGANRRDLGSDPADRRSGTGGFSLMAQTTVPILQDLNTAAGRKAMGLDDTVLADTAIVQVRAAAGEDASCLNLNRAQRPTLLGVDPNRMRDRFTVRQLLGRDVGHAGQRAGRRTDEDAWPLLEQDLGPDVVPAIGDHATVFWGLGLSVGDQMEYTDDQGRRFSVQIVGVLANSVLQGNLVVSERAFLDRFPSKAGYSLFLVDVPEHRASAVSDHLSGRIADLGMSVESTADRLAAFARVEATYLAVFMALGGLGLVLGTVGLALVVLRNLLERRGELAMMRAVGLYRATLVKMAFFEHWGLLVAGLVVGAGSAFIAIGPAVRPGPDQLPVGQLGATLAAIALSGAIWVALACVLALRGRIWDAIRGE